MNAKIYVMGVFIFLLAVAGVLSAIPPTVTAIAPDIGLTFRTGLPTDAGLIRTVVNNDTVRDRGVWCDTGEVSTLDIAIEWSKQRIIRGSRDYIVSVGVDGRGNVKTVVEGWIFDGDKFLFKAVVWDAANIPEDEWILYVHAAVSEVVRQVEPRGVNQLHVAATEGTWIKGYVDFLAQSGVNVDNYNYYMSVEDFKALTVRRGQSFEYGPQIKKEQKPEGIPRNARQIDERTWIVKS